MKITQIKQLKNANIMYPEYMAKMSSLVYNLEDFEKNYAYVEAVFINLDREDR